LIQKFETPVVAQIEEALTAEQFRKLQELSYAEATAAAEAEAAAEATAAAEAEAAAEATAAAEAAAIPDTTKPIISPPADLVIEATGSLTSVELGEAIAMDENGIQLLVNNAPTLFPLGSSTIIWTAIDNSGNSASAIQQISIVDTTSPIIHSVPDITAEAVVPYDNIIELQEPSADDLLGVISITNDAPEFFPIGETIVTWTTIDSSNNFSSLTQLVSVIDTTAPEILPLEDITLEASSVDANIVNLDNPIVSDIQDTTIYIIAPDVFPIGETTVTWTAVDASDNSAITTQTVTIIDTTKPGLSIPDNQTVEASSLDETLVDIGQAEAYDITGISSIVHNAPDVFSLGSTLIAWTATDNHDNITTAYQTITVVDTTSPIIISPQDITSEATDPTMNYIELGELVASDSVSIESIINDKPITFPFGSTTVTWTVTDTSG